MSAPKFEWSAGHAWPFGGLTTLCGIFHEAVSYDPARADCAACFDLLAQRPKWQPIATAPKDGTHILAALNSERYYVSPPTVVHWFDGVPEEGGWYLSVCDYGDHRALKPVWWMPLPSQDSMWQQAQQEAHVCGDPNSTCDSMCVERSYQALPNTQGLDEEVS